MIGCQNFFEEEERLESIVDKLEEKQIPLSEDMPVSEALVSLGWARPSTPS